MEKLKIGDKVYHKKQHHSSDNIFYEFSTVERLTKTQAILENGTKLINEPVTDYWQKCGFEIYGDRWDKWYIVTPEIIEEAKKERYRQKVNKWFKEKQFTYAERQAIYQQLNPEPQTT